MLIVVSGLSGVGKTTLSKRLATVLGAAYLRADTIEQAMADAGFDFKQNGGAGYDVMARVARENLKAGNEVIVDSVNPWPITRELWRGAARDAGSPILEVELFCSDAGEHRRRVETRASDVEGLRLPTWQDVLDRDYRPWDNEPLRIDTVKVSVDEAVELIVVTRRAIRR